MERSALRLRISAGAAGRSSSVLLLADAEELAVLLGGEESDDGVGAHPEVVSGETSPEASHTLSCHRLGEAVSNARVGHLSVRARLLLLHLRLDVVEGERADSSGNSGNHRAAELDLEGRSVRAHGSSGNIFGGLVRNKHRYVQGGGSHHGGNGTLPQRSDTLLSNDASESVNNVLVVTTLSLREGGVGLHPDKSQIARVTNEGTEATGEEGAASALQSAQALASVPVHLNPLSQVKVDTKTQRAVDDLSQQGRVQATIHDPYEGSLRAQRMINSQIIAVKCRLTRGRIHRFRQSCKPPLQQ